MITLPGLCANVSDICFSCSVSCLVQPCRGCWSASATASTAGKGLDVSKGEEDRREVRFVFSPGKYNRGDMSVIDGPMFYVGYRPSN